MVTCLASLGDADSFTSICKQEHTWQFFTLFSIKAQQGPSLILEILESLGNTTATTIKTCSLPIAFLLEDKGDYKLYSYEHSSPP